MHKLGIQASNTMEK